MNLLGASGSRDEKENLENVAALLHAENLCHPWANPFQVFGGLDDPNENDLAGRAGSIRVRGYEVANMWYGVGDTNTGCKKHDCTVRLEALVAVWTFDVGVGNEWSSARLFGLPVEGVCKASASTDDQRHRGCVGGSDVLSSHWEGFLVGQVYSILTPSEREGVACPHSNSGNVQVNMLARPEFPGPRGAESDANRIAGESFDLGLGAALATKVLSDDEPHAGCALKYPADDGSGQHKLNCVHAVKMNPDRCHCSDCKKNVEMEEGLVEGVANDRGRLDEDGTEGSKSDGSAENHRAALHGTRNHSVALLGTQSDNLAAEPECSMCNSLKNNDASNPTVNHVEVVEADAQQPNQWVVSSCEQEKRNHVECCQNASTAQAHGIELVAAPIDLPDSENNVEGKVSDQEESLHASWKRSHVHGSRKLELAVMTASQQGSRQPMALELGPSLIGNAEVTLPSIAGGSVVEVGQSANVVQSVNGPAIDQDNENDRCPCRANVFDHLLVDVLRIDLGLRLLVLGEGERKGGCEEQPWCLVGRHCVCSNRCPSVPVDVCGEERCSPRCKT